MRDMFRFINSYKIGMPMEVEVEHHIVNQFADDIMRAGILFPVSSRGYTSEQTERVYRRALCHLQAG